MMARSSPLLTTPQFERWRRLVETRTGIDFSRHRPILQGALNRRLHELGCTDYDAYYQRVEPLPSGWAEWQMLLDSLTIKETRFFRQPAAFELLRNYLRERVSSPYRAGAVDLWSAGCATGEEAYSLAMVADETLADHALFGVLATDISAAALRRVRAGHYSGDRVEGLPDGLRRYFRPSSGGYTVLSALQRRVCCSQANLLETHRLPPLAMDIIFCQNVLVYFRPERVAQVLDALVERLKPGGLLVLGPGEAPRWRHPHMASAGYSGVSAYLRCPPETQYGDGMSNEFRTA